MALLSSHLTPTDKATLNEMKAITLPDGREVMQVPLFDFEQAKKSKNIYLLDYDMIHDIHRQEKMPSDVFKELISYGQVLDCVIDVEAVGGIDDDLPQHLPFLVLYATVMELAIMRTIGLPEERIHQLYDRDHPETPATPNTAPLLTPALEPLAAMVATMPASPPPVVTAALPSAPPVIPTRRRRRLRPAPHRPRHRCG